MKKILPALIFIPMMLSGINGSIYAQGCDITHPCPPGYSCSNNVCHIYLCKCYTRGYGCPQGTNYLDCIHACQKRCPPLTGFNISQNPFSNSSTISFSIPEEQKISLKMYNVNGLLVKVLYENVFEGGEHNLSMETEYLDGKPTYMGIYFIRFEAGDFTRTSIISFSKS